jgi:hypothetical protein
MAQTCPLRPDVNRQQPGPGLGPPHDVVTLVHIRSTVSAASASNSSSETSQARASSSEGSRASMVLFMALILSPANAIPASGSTHPQAGRAKMADLASAPIPKFASTRGTSDANFGIKRGTSNFMILVRFFEFEVPTRACRANDRNFKFTALVLRGQQSCLASRRVACAFVNPILWLLSFCARPLRRRQSTPRRSPSK